ncbi:hypothetical protein ACPC54_23300 [Kitasatospora sp. NPDC094028]
MSTPAPLGGFEATTISDEARGLYISMRLGAPVDESRDLGALAELLDFGLVSFYERGGERGGERIYVTLDPQEAAARKQRRLYQQISRAMSEAAGLPESLQDLAMAYHYSVPDPLEGSVEHLSGMERINSRLSELISTATHELLTAQPGGPRPVEVLRFALARDLAALRRGVAMRTLYRVSARSERPTAEWVTTISEAGGLVRTLDADFLRLVIIDRRAAALTDFTPWTGSGPEPVRGLIVHDEGVVHYLAAMFDQDWSRAVAWRGEEAKAPAGLTDLQRAVVLRVAAGSDQAAVAREVGISPRRVFAQLAELRAAYGCNSTAQLMYELGRRAGLREAASGAAVASESG